MNATPSTPSFTELARSRTESIAPPRGARPAAAIWTIVFAILFVLLLAQLGSYALPPVENLFQGGR